MPLIQLLSDKKQAAYENAPIFTGNERKHFLSLPASLQIKANSFPSLTNKVGFRLMFGYFLATNQFYPTELFNQKDIQYLCNQYGMMSFAVDFVKYNTSTYFRHRQIILEHFAFQAYQPRVHNAMVSTTIHEQVYSWEDPKLIVGYILEWLKWRRIERPSYYNLQLILTNAIRKRNKEIKQKFGRLLNTEQKAALDKLLEKQIDDGKEEYVLTTLHKLSPSDAPKHIRANVEKLEIIQSIFETLQPLLKQLQLNHNAIRHFGEIVQNTESGHIVRKEEIDRYFNLATFCAYQRCIFEDWMVRTLISVCKVAGNRATAKEKERLFEGRKQRKKAFQQVMHIAEDTTSLIQKIRQLAWMNITAAQKEQQLQALLPKEKPDTAPQPNDLEQIKEEQQLAGEDEYYNFLAEQSQSLQIRVNPILKKLTLNTADSDKDLLKGIQYFKDKDGVITKTAPVNFFNDEEQAALINKDGKFNASLYKILLFQKVKDGFDRGKLQLKHTYQYKNMDNILIPKDLWDKDPESFLDKANLSHLKDVKARIADYKKVLHHHYQNTNDNILAGNNKFFRKGKSNKYHIFTPKVEKEEQDISLFPGVAAIPLSEILSTVDTTTNFVEHFEHLQPLYRKKRPDKSLFFAGITAFGCNLGIPTMAKAASQVRSSQLENATNWYFSLANINKANDAISNFTAKLPLADLYLKKEGELRTSSDGQKIRLISENTIFADYSAKYYRKGRGIVSYTFVDERCIPFYSVIIDASLREAIYVLDGLLHNDTIKSTMGLRQS